MSKLGVKRGCAGSRKIGMELSLCPDIIKDPWWPSGNGPEPVAVTVTHRLWVRGSNPSKHFVQVYYFINITENIYSLSYNQTFDDTYDINQPSLRLRVSPSPLPLTQTGPVSQQWGHNRLIRLRVIRVILSSWVGSSVIFLQQHPRKGERLLSVGHSHWIIINMPRAEARKQNVYYYGVLVIYKALVRSSFIPSVSS